MTHLPTILPFPTKPKPLKDLKGYLVDITPALPEHYINEIVKFSQSDDNYKKAITNYIAVNAPKRIAANDTKGAFNAIFFDLPIPKSIRKILLNFSFFPEHHLSQINDMIAEYGVDHVRSLLLYIIAINKDVLTPSSLSFTFHKIISILNKGMPFKPMLKFLKKRQSFSTESTFTYLQDIYKFLYTALDTLKMPENFIEIHQLKTFEAIHDYLSKHYTLYLKQKATERYGTTHVSNFSSHTDNELTIRPIKNTGELIDVGLHMRHCVAIYMDKHFKNDCEILVITPADNENDYLACIEVTKYDNDVSGFRVRQAALKYNRHLLNNPTLYHFTKAYCEKNDINWSALVVI